MEKCRFCGKNEFGINGAEFVIREKDKHVCIVCIELMEDIISDSKNSKKWFKTSKHHCSYCGKGEYKVKNLIVGPNSIQICNECVEKVKKNV